VKGGEGPSAIPLEAEAGPAPIGQPQAVFQVLRACAARAACPGLEAGVAHGDAQDAPVQARPDQEATPWSRRGDAVLDGAFCQGLKNQRGFPQHICGWIPVPFDFQAVTQTNSLQGELSLQEGPLLPEGDPFQGSHVQHLLVKVG